MDSTRLTIFQTMDGFMDCVSDDMPDGAYFAIMEDEIQNLMDEYEVTGVDSNDMMFEYLSYCKEQNKNA